ncbi:E3 ubiquitin-protein ligase FANCL [Anopheles nili]|uniref:E3 ubiquitin-protein ligase FANCL n=1 Tax=Anopheles nili TaxID=185578 RepID=UPI00237A9303|nr:E3 ubiquitin-protein ligase FANCL [Anopheles nili]
MEDFLRKYPFLVQMEPSYFIGLYKQVFKLEFCFPCYPSTEKHRVNVFRGNSPVILGPELSAIPEVDNYVDSLLKSLQRFDTKLNAHSSSAISNQESTVLVMLSLEILSINRQYGCQAEFDQNLTVVEFSCFENKEKHKITLKRTIGHDYRVSQHTLPVLQVSEMFKRQTSLQRHIQTFLDTLEQLDEFYNNLNTIDELCYVILPAKIDTRTTYRIFKYDQKVFLKVALHPLQQTAVDIAFFGPTKLVAKLRETYDDRQKDWDPEYNVYTNLLRIFNMIAFPMRPTGPVGSASECETSCGICMDYHDTDDHIPIISCDNDQCKLIFHVHCLREWFSAQRESKKMFSISIGKCPFCTHKISSSFDDIMSLLA